jgi:hypothetical protein
MMASGASSSAPRHTPNVIAQLPHITFLPITDSPIPRTAIRFRTFLSVEADRLLSNPLRQTTLMPIQIWDDSTAHSLDSVEVLNHARALESFHKHISHINLLREVYHLYEAALYETMGSLKDAAAKRLTDQFLSSPLRTFLVDEDNNVRPSARETIRKMHSLYHATTCRARTLLHDTHDYIQLIMSDITRHADAIERIDNLQQPDYTQWREDYTYSGYKVDHCSREDLCSLPLLYLHAILDDVGPSLTNPLQQLSFPVHLNDGDELLGHRDTDLRHMTIYLHLQHLLTVDHIDTLQAGVDLMTAQELAGSLLDKMTTSTIETLDQTDKLHQMIRSSAFFISAGARPLHLLRRSATAAHLPFNTDPWTANLDLDREEHEVVTDDMRLMLQSAIERTMAGAPPAQAYTKASLQALITTIKQRQEIVLNLLFCMSDGAQELLQEDYRIRLPDQEVQPILAELRHTFTLI